MEIIYRLREDFKPYFEDRLNEVKDYITNPNIKKIVVTAGPYRPYGANASWIDPFNGIISLDFYSALRTGFGQLSFTDLALGISNNEIGPFPEQFVGDVFTEFVKPDFNNKHFEAFSKYCTVQVEGKYNMYNQAKEAAKSSGLTLLEYGIIQMFYSQLNEAKPEIKTSIEREYLNKLKSNGNN